MLPIRFNAQLEVEAKDADSMLPIKFNAQLEVEAKDAESTLPCRLIAQLAVDAYEELLIVLEAETHDADVAVVDEFALVANDAVVANDEEVAVVADVAVVAFPRNVVASMLLAVIAPRELTDATCVPIAVVHT